MVMIDNRQLSEKRLRLSSTHEFFQLAVCAEGIQVGHLKDLLFEQESWSIQYLIIELSNPFRKLILISPTWIEWIDRTQNLLHLGLKYRHVMQSPEYQPNAPLTELYEERLYDYYGLEKYH